MNEISLASLRSRLVASTLVLLATAATGKCPGPQHPPKSAEKLVHNLQDALFRSTWDYSVDGRRAVDAYWKSSELGSLKSLDAGFYDQLRVLYASVGGDRVVRATLTDSGWSITGPRVRLILTQNQPFTGLLVLVENRTSHPRQIVAAIESTPVAGTQTYLQLDPGETVSFAPEMRSETLGQFHADLLFRGRPQGRATLMGEVRQAVRLRMRVLDPQGIPTPVRVYVHGADGLSHFAVGALDRVMWMTAEHYFYSPGVVEMVLPAGRARVEVRKGFDCQPVMREFDLAGGDAEINTRLQWLRDMNADGWYSGDDHIHGNYTGEQWSTPADDLLAVRAEGLNVANMMVSNSTGGAIHDERYFEGRPNAISSTGAILYWNQEMRTWSYGHLLLLNLKRLVRPLYTGFPGTTHWEDYPSNLVQEERAHTDGGVTLYAHPALQFDNIPEGSLAGESVVDVALGGIDAMEVFCSHDEPSMELWYKFLNLGFKLAISGGSDAFLNQGFAFLAGGERVYVYTGETFDYAAWIDGLRSGRSFATVGPLLDFEVDGKPPGTEKRIASGPAAVPVRVRVVSSIPISRAEVVLNGRVVGEASSPQPTDRLEWQGNVTVERSAWLAARVWGPNDDRIANGPSRWSQRRSGTLVLVAHSSPSYVYMERQPIFSVQDRDFCLRWLESLDRRILKNGQFSSDAHRDEVLATFARARQVYERMGTTPAEEHR